MGIYDFLWFLGALAVTGVLAMVSFRAARDEEGTPGLMLKLLTGVLAIGFFATLVGLVDAYFFEVETPLKPPEASVPAKPLPREEAERVDVVDKTPDRPDAREEHRDSLKEFEDRNLR